MIFALSACFGHFVEENTFVTVQNTIICMFDSFLKTIISKKAKLILELAIYPSLNIESNAYLCILSAKFTNR